MSDKNFLEMLKSDGKNAAYRVASTQMVNGTKAAILKLLEKNGKSSDSIKAVSELMETEFGNAVVGMILGMGLTYAPVISEDARAQKLAEEFRVNGMATAGNALIGVAMEEFLPIVTMALAKLPPAEADNKEVVSESNEEEEEDEAVAAVKQQMKA